MISCSSFRRNGLKLSWKNEALNQPNLLLVFLNQMKKDNLSVRTPHLLTRNIQSAFCSSRRIIFCSQAGSKKIPAYRDAEINLDSTTSDRPEWCTVRYHGVFCPDNVYLVHLRWLVSTGSVINQLVQSWARKVTLYGFHLVPVPTFLPDGQLARSDPFTSAHHIPLDVSWIREHASFQGDD